MLRFLHIQKLSPSGWVILKKNTFSPVIGEDKVSTCDYEYKIDCLDIEPQTDKEDRVPYKIYSFDIEASSSHGDFPF